MFTQGMVTHETYQGADGSWVSPDEVTVSTENGERRAVETTTGRPVAIGPVVKMSKSKRNGIDPDEILKTYGADAARWFVLSDSPPERDVEWTEAGVDGASRFQQRIWKLVADTVELGERSAEIVQPEGEALAVRKAVHRAVHAVGEEIENLRFNRAVAHIYELTNALAKFLAADGARDPAGIAVLREGAERLVQLVAPMMPHLAETCWQALGRDGLVADTPWPQADPALLVDDTVTVAVQVNGKRRGELVLPRGANGQEVEQQALSLDAVARILGGQQPRKVIIVPDRIVNVVA
jgi:leucyl-tRNA synthetase